MTLYDALLEKYGYNEPILTGEIQFKNYSRSWIYKELNRLCEAGEIKRFEKGIYYIPKKSPLGFIGYELPLLEVVAKEYINSIKEVI